MSAAVSAPSPCSASSVFPCISASTAKGAAPSKDQRPSREEETISSTTSSSRKPAGRETNMAVTVDPEDCCINLIDMKFIDGTLYFQAEDNENLESDHFGRLEAKTSILRNVNNQVLIISQGNQPLFEDMPDLDCKENESQIRFIIFNYKDSLHRGLAVTISVRHNRLSTLSCKDKIISFPEIDPPTAINDEESDIIFFMKRATGFNNKIEFESSLYKGYFLACKRENGLFKLILKEKDKGLNVSVSEIKDKSVIFTIEDSRE